MPIPIILRRGGVVGLNTRESVIGIARGWHNIRAQAAYLLSMQRAHVVSGQFLGDKSRPPNGGRKKNKDGRQYTPRLCFIWFYLLYHIYPTMYVGAITNRPRAHTVRPYSILLRNCLARGF